MIKLKTLKGILAFSIMLFTFMNAAAQPAITETGLSQTVENGAIFHAWCWSFNTIKANLSEIAAAGFSAVQTSPVSQCLVGEDGGLEIFGNGKWYYHYQPVKYVVGNYQLGTEKEFISMCSEAHRYGIKIIVDTVINHCTATYSAIDPALRNMEGGGFHPQNGNWSETDRYEETQFSLSGLWDLNTQNPNVQNHILAFLKRCVADGADGFRYDAAKLIELPDDVSAGYTREFSSRFWPVVLSNGAAFQYGEVLQEGGNISYSKDIKTGYDDSISSRLSAYQKYMKTTNSLYGFRLRDAAGKRDFSVDFVGDNLLPKGAHAEKVVTWVESHDNYCNDASYKEIGDNEIILAWAVIAARKNGTPLFFNRPMGSTKNSPWGKNRIGDAGSNLYKDPQVSEVNFFRNVMQGKAEELSNPTGEKEVLFIERGSSGLVIINAGYAEKKFDGVPVKKISDGEYTEQVRGGTVKVEKGKLYGTVPASSVSVVYNKEIKQVPFKSEIECSVPSGYFLDDSLKLRISVRNCRNASVIVGKSAPVPVKDGDVIEIGKDIAFGKSVQVVLSAVSSEGKKVSAKYAYQKALYKKDTAVYLDSKAMGPDWAADKVYAYIYNEGGSKSNASWPGVQMEDIGDGIYRYVLPYELESQKTYVIFNNGNGGGNNQYPNGAGLDMFKGSKMILDASRAWKAYKD